MRSPFGDIRGRALWVVLGCLVCQLGLGFSYAFGPLARDIIDEFGWTRAVFSSARAPQLWVIALASPLVGALTVRFGARSILSVSCLGLAGGFALMSGVQGLWQFTAVIVLLGFVLTGLGDIAVGAVVTQWVERGRGLALGLVYTGSNLGGALVTRVAADVADRSSWREALLVLAVAALVVLVPFALFAVRDRSEGPVASAAGGAPGSERISVEPDLDLRAAARTRSFWILGFTLFAFWFYFLAILEHFVLFLTDAGMPRSEAAAHFSNAIAMGLVSKIGFGWIADRLHPRAALLLDFGLLALSSVLLLLVGRPGALPLFVVSYGFATAARDVVTPLVVSHAFGVRFLAQIYGALMLTLLPGGTLGPIFAGLVHDRTGSYDVAFASYAALNALSFGALFWVRDERRGAGLGVARAAAGADQS